MSICEFYKFLAEWAEKSIFIYPILLSLLSATIFYFFFNVLPKRNERKNVDDHIVDIVYKILNCIESIIFTSANHNIEIIKIRSGNLTKSDLEKGLQGVTVNDDIKFMAMGKDGKQAKVGGFIERDINELKEQSDILLRYIIFLDTSLIKLINETLRNGYIKRFLSIYNSPRRLDLGGGKAIVFPPDKLSIYVDFLFQYHKTYKKIEKWLFKKFSQKEIVLRRMVIHFWDQKNFGQAIRPAKKLIKLNKYNVFAIQYLLKAYVADGKYKKAKSISNKFIGQKSITIEQIKASFDVDNEFTDKDFNKIN